MDGRMDGMASSHLCTRRATISRNRRWLFNFPRMGPGGFEPPTSRLSGVRSNQAELRARASESRLPAAHQAVPPKKNASRGGATRSGVQK